MSNLRPILPHLLRGLLAGLLWTAGFFAAFPLWRFSNLVGIILLALTAGVLASLPLSAGEVQGWKFRLPAGAGLAAVLLPLVWNSRRYSRLVLALYQGFHVTEAGFAGLFSLLIYSGVSLLCLFLTSSILAFRREKHRKDL